MIEVKVVDCEMVVKSVTTVGTNKVGICPLTFMALLAEFKLMAADNPLGRETLLEPFPPKRFIRAADISEAPA